jgi:hypothetical protein
MYLCQVIPSWIAWAGQLSDDRQLSSEPFPGQLSHSLQRPRLLKQMRGARDDNQLLGAAQPVVSFCRPDGMVTSRCNALVSVVIAGALLWLT